MFQGNMIEWKVTRGKHYIGGNVFTAENGKTFRATEEEVKGYRDKIEPVGDIPEDNSVVAAFPRIRMMKDESGRYEILNINSGQAISGVSLSKVKAEELAEILEIEICEEEEALDEAIPEDAPEEE